MHHHETLMRLHQTYSSVQCHFQLQSIFCGSHGFLPRAADSMSPGVLPAAVHAPVTAFPFLRQNIITLFPAVLVTSVFILPAFSLYLFPASPFGCLHILLLLLPYLRYAQSFFPQASQPEIGHLSFSVLIPMIAVTDFVGLII